jgi:hypothetical protein
MYISTLEQNETVRDLVTGILSDKTFKSTCELYFWEIFEDGKIDSDEIPLLVNLFMTIYNDYNKLYVSKDNLKSVCMLFIARLLTELNTGPAYNEPLLLLQLESHIDVLLMTVNVVRYAFPCCGSKPQGIDDKERTLYKKLKLTKIEGRRLHNLQFPKQVVETVDSEHIIPAVDAGTRVDVETRVDANTRVDAETSVDADTRVDVEVNAVTVNEETVTVDAVDGRVAVDTVDTVETDP